MKYRLRADHSVTCEVTGVAPPQNADPGPRDSVRYNVDKPFKWYTTLPRALFDKIWEPVPEEPHPFVKWLEEAVAWELSTEYRPAEITRRAALARYVNDNPPPVPPVFTPKGGPGIPVWASCQVTEKGLPEGWKEDRDIADELEWLLKLPLTSPEWQECDAVGLFRKSAAEIRRLRKLNAETLEVKQAMADQIEKLQREVQEHSKPRSRWDKIVEAFDRVYRCGVSHAVIDPNGLAMIRESAGTPPEQRIVVGGVEFVTRNDYRNLCWAERRAKELQHEVAALKEALLKLSATTTEKP